MLILTDKAIELIIEQAEIININSKIINFCTSCFNCWTKTPGSCVIRDDQVLIYPKIAMAKEIVYICRVKYGCYDVPFKAMLERCLPLQQPFLMVFQQETHHELRGVETKDAIIIGYGEAIMDSPFRGLVTGKIKKFAKAIERGETLSIKTHIPISKWFFVKAGNKYWSLKGSSHGKTKIEMQTMEIK